MPKKYMAPIDPRTIRKEQAKDTVPPDDSIATVCSLGNRLEVTTLAFRRRNTSGLRKGNERYRVNSSTGEMTTYTPRKNRGEDVGSLQASFRNIRRMVEANFRGGESELHIVLSYRGNLNPSPSELYNDFKKFWKRLRYRYPCLEYLLVIEPHEDGRFHGHLLVVDAEGHYLFIPKKDLKALWGHGSVYVGRIRNVTALGLYLSNKWQTHPNRLRFYPPRFRLCRWSDGLYKPISKKVSRDDLKQMVKAGNYTLKYSDAVQIEAKTVTGEPVTVQKIYHETYVAYKEEL